MNQHAIEQAIIAECRNFVERCHRCGGAGEVRQRQGSFVARVPCPVCRKARGHLRTLDDCLGTAMLDAGGSKLDNETVC